MKANELRIGNLLKCKFKGASEYEDIRCNKDIIFHFDIYDLKPIPLTEDWLIKLGAIKIKEGVFEIGYLKFRIHSHQYGIDFHFGTSGNHYIKPHFVHSLQNLYFALTNEELKIK